MEGKVHQRVIVLIVVCFLDLATKSEADKGAIYVMGLAS
jgi:hypothetical protein